MQFNSTIFLIFGALFFLIWPVMRGRKRSRWVYLVIASFIFYGWWDWRFLFLIVASGLIDFFAALAIARFPRQKTMLLMVSIVGNLGSLAAFKYSAFIAESLDFLLYLVGLDVRLVLKVPEFMLLLPIGISFYTFQSMSYTIDVYRGRLKPTRDPFHFFAYLSLFPQLVAGPIVRASDLLPQLLEDRHPTGAERWEGLRLIVHGYFKKVVIADNLAVAVNRGFIKAGIGEQSCLFWWMIVTMFAFQIYCDFSGYSDIARGLARWMGYSLQRNFDHPYTAASMREFWARWHISLSTWFRDYVYIPLGGSRCKSGRADWNLAITMLLSGLWHGAAWRFVLWGAVHTVFLRVERLTDWPRRVLCIKGGRHLATILTLVQVWVGWVFFRAETMADALTILKAMFSFSGGSFSVSPIALTVLAVAVMRELYFYFRLDGDVFQMSPRVRRVLQPIVLALMIVACVYLRGRGNEFIYFQF